jgi:hypothetical protein
LSIASGWRLFKHGSVASHGGNSFEPQIHQEPRAVWSFLQGGIRQIEENDYAVIVSGLASGSSTASVGQDISSQSLFALEAHLEDFIDRNWSNIPWGAALELYRDGEQTGRQFPAGT